MKRRGERKRRGRLRHVVAAIFLCGIFLCGRGWNACAQEQPSNEEYRVYEAALNLMDPVPKADLHVAIYGRTLNSKCGAASDNPVLANGCTFFWMSPDKAEDVERILRTRWHGLSRSAWKSFRANNADSITLHDPLATPWKHHFLATSSGMRTPGDDSKEWEAPDMTIFLSRVGFNSNKTEAIVYVLVFSYVGQAATAGDYLRFRADQRGGQDRTWSLAGRVRYFSGADDSFVRVQPFLGPPVGTLSGRKHPELRLAAEWK